MAARWTPASMAPLAFVALVDHCQGGYDYSNDGDDEKSFTSSLQSKVDVY